MVYTPVQKFSGKPLKIAFKAALEGGKSYLLLVSLIA